MKTIKVEQVHSKKIEYKDKSTGEAKSFMKYAALYETVWYEIKGKGNNQIKEGDTLTGEYTEQDWEANGKTGTNRILALLDRTTADIINRVENLEHSVSALLIAKGDTVGADAKTPVTDSQGNDSDLPF